MDDNFEQFSIYSGKILETLSLKFPVPCLLDKDSIIKEYLKFEESDELKNARMQKDIADIVIALERGGEEEVESAKREKRRLEEYIYSRSEEKASDCKKQAAIFYGSLGFLVEEGLVREAENGGFQLTSRAFFHLNKKFEEGSIKNKNTPLLCLKEIFATGADVSKSTAAGVATSVIATVLGFG
ncbi:MAG: Hypothetical protein XD36_3031 [Halomonas sp. 54_146]|nr:MULTISPECIES: hypothetical protein [unclassified Halomonas]KUJ86534.1 MAG: Hypothetical protein XD36_3031 [Halomonas sp. 54_146]HAA44776.1 hypothetical protein [Halomonas sp.]